MGSTSSEHKVHLEDTIMPKEASFCFDDDNTIKYFMLEFPDLLF